MTIALALGMVVVALVLLSNDRIPIEISSLALVVLLVFTGLVTPAEALAGFSNDATIFIFALLALTQGLAATGVMQIIGRRMLALGRLGPPAFTGALLTVVCLFSSVASNTAVTAAFLPVAVASASQLKVPASRLLMPMAFCSMLGGTVTLFGTSTNLVVSAAMEELGLARLGFLELTPIGLPLAAVGVFISAVAVRWLLPTRNGSPQQQSPVHRPYLTEAALTPGSRLIGKKLSHLTEVLGFPVHAVVRSGELRLPDDDLVLFPDDHLLISGSLEGLLKVKDLRSLGLRADLRYAHAEDKPLTLVELLIPPTSSLSGLSVRGVRFAERFGVLVLGIHRHPSLQSSDRELDLLGSVTTGRALADVPLFTGDVLLVSGPEERIRELAGGDDLTVLGMIPYERPRYRRALVALAIFLCTVTVAATRITSPAIAGLTGMLAMVATGCVSSRTAFRVDWRVVIMIGALLTLGRAMEKSGAGEFLAQAILPLGRVLGPRGLLVALMAATIALSVPMSNQAAALIMLPVGVHAALEMGLEPRTFAIGTCLAASCALLTPLEPSAALVYGPGRYRFSDFLRVGGPVTLVLLSLLAIGVPSFWPFVAR